jgi:large subunit ribosomal protein L23
MEINNYNYTNFFKFIKYPLISEKSMFIFDKDSKYTLIVDKLLKKYEIKFILEKLFNFKIIKINTIILPVKFKLINKKKGKIKQYKKVYIQLQNKRKLSTFFI